MWVFFTAAVIIGLAFAGLYNAKEVNCSIEINAPRERVWRILSDFSRYQEWNPFIVSVNGEAVQRSPLVVKIRPAIGGTMDFNLLLQSVSPPGDMIWLGQTLLPKLLDGRHFFHIESLSAKQCRFVQGERYTGLFLYFAWPILSWSVRRSFSDMNIALKLHAENAKQ